MDFCLDGLLMSNLLSTQLHPPTHTLRAPLWPRSIPGRECDTLFWPVVEEIETGIKAGQTGTFLDTCLNPYHTVRKSHAEDLTWSFQHIPNTYWESWPEHFRPYKRLNFYTKQNMNEWLLERNMKYRRLGYKKYKIYNYKWKEFIKWSIHLKIFIIKPL